MGWTLILASKGLRKDIIMTAIYSILHMFVDGVCALAMFGVFIPQENGYFYMLLYNFCAFALQMPLGIILDALASERLPISAQTVPASRTKPLSAQRCASLPVFRAFSLAPCTAALGVLCTIIGALTHPIILGIGNALFHIGGGIGVIAEDSCKSWRGKGLGIFVAPGAFGLYLGTLAAKGGLWRPCFWMAALAMLLFGLAMFWLQAHTARRTGSLAPSAAITGRTSSSAAKTERELPPIGKTEAKLRSAAITAITCCFLVVILRSYLGMSVTFPWKTGQAAGLFCVLALVTGKMAGGLLAAHYGARKTAILSLAAAALCYLFSASMPFGLAALFLFNMTMPITLYWMVCLLPQMPGFAFGFLTFALFLGFLPQYFGAVPILSGSLLGCAGSLLSLMFIFIITNSPPP